MFRKWIASYHEPIARVGAACHDNAPRARRPWGADGASAMVRRPRPQDGGAWCRSRATWASGQTGHPNVGACPRPWRAGGGGCGVAGSSQASTRPRRRGESDGQAPWPRGGARCRDGLRLARPATICRRRSRPVVPTQPARKACPPPMRCESATYRQAVPAAPVVSGPRRRGEDGGLGPRPCTVRPCRPRLTSRAVPGRNSRRPPLPAVLE